MSKCPYIHKNKNNYTEFENQHNGQSVLVCDICGNIFFRCPKCQETNRSLALFCRSCCKSISLSQTENNLKLNLRNYEERNTLPLPSNSGKILTLMSYCGFIFITTVNKCFVSNMNEILGELDFFGESPLGSSFIKTETKAEVLITSNRKIYSINLLDLNKTVEVLYEATDSASIVHAAVTTTTDIYWVEADKNSATKRFSSLQKGDHRKYNGGILPLLKGGENKIFITTTDKLELYDSQNGNFSSVTLTDGKKSDVINTGCQPVFDEQKNAVYLFGEKNLWRIDLGEGELKAHPLQMESTGDECMTITGDGRILVSRSDGFYILNSFGTVEWQADSIYIPEASNFDGRTPQTSGQYCIFSGQKGNSSVFRVYLLSDPNKYSERIVLGDLQSCAPLFRFGHLFVPSERSREQSLKIYRLKELY